MNGCVKQDMNIFLLLQKGECQIIYWFILWLSSNQIVVIYSLPISYLSFHGSKKLKRAQNIPLDRNNASMKHSTAPGIQLSIVKKGKKQYVHETFREKGSDLGEQTRH